jgi:cyclopropane-fatty-acyl-phospholipid synthase
MNERLRAVEAIQFHYDVGNDFYALWLDPRMVYSCALWDGTIAADDLAGAQLAKLDYHLDQIGIEQASTLLDVGCGWGAMLGRAVERNPDLASAVGLTLSQEQCDHVQRLALRQPHIGASLQNWLDHQPAAPYDGIISVGAFEHFATPQDTADTRMEKYRDFFRFCSNNLKKGGALSLQSIAYLNMARSNANQFMENEIFPNADLPYLSEIVAACEGIMEITVVRNDRLDYARTCSLWLQGLRAQREAAIALAGSATVARFEKYLALSSVGFHQAKICLIRMTARKK